ncbi:hypothetical protein OBBRIDRAFT_891524 [Obba rivulosa]|uniref:HECT-type E3 ubiquitin transferase n=1 Tax=Obba rivulosa TaxID=1052685 RepID=A0A8E2DFK0_9APHY|nr:hypothetical protein OBBRIDRAFT_891524 [Obba rivulosa]
MKILHKSKKALVPLPQVAELINKLLETPNEELHEVLSQIDTWKWPRSDLNVWTPVLNKFDEILEEVIRDYDVDKLQVNVFTPLTKKTVCEILRFERLLLENSTNRKTYNSYDRLSSLMLTSDLDVLILTLTLLLRPAQQYSAQAAVSHALNISTPRLISLAKRWPNLREYDINLIDLVSESGRAQVNALPNEAREVNFTFYRKDAAGVTVVKEQEKGKATEVDVFGPVSQSPRKPGSSSTGPSIPAPSSGAVVIHIDSETITIKEPMHILADIVELHDVPDIERFELLTRIRAARAVTPLWAHDREKMVIARLLATAIFGHTHTESQAQSTLFLYEPDLITHIAELLQLDRGVDVQVQTAAIYALDALARYKNKMQDVLTAVNAGVNHGILMALLRKTVAEVAQPMSTLPQSFVEALLSFLTFLSAHASGGNMVVGAGLIPLLIQIIENRLPNRLYVVSKTMQLIDNVLYGFTNSFQLFCNARGVEVLVDRIEYEVDLDIAQCSNELSPNEIVIPYGKLSVARAAVLKHLMRSMHRMMQSAGTAEGLRGLLDSSLLSSVKKIMQHRDTFGPTILALAINTMATFIHNEPTCLPVIQEKNLPETFYGLIESGLEPVIEVIQAIPNAIGALCLNQQGQDQLTARPSIVPSIFSIFTSEQHQRILQDKENAVLVGTSIEELIRHHPSLKDSVFASIKATMKKIEELGNSYVPSDDKKQWYMLVPVTSQQASASAPARSADEDVVMEAAEAEAPQQTRPVSPAADAGFGEELGSSHRDESSARAHDNIVVSYLDVFGKFLEGFFQHVPHCRDFVSDRDALNLFGRLTALPCLPYDFANSVASDSMVQVIRTMAESATNETLDFLVNMVHEILASTQGFWENMQEQSKLLPLVHIDDESSADANKRFRDLVTLHTRLSLLSDIYATAGYSHHRATVALLQSLLTRPSFAIIPELGALHRACVWENIVLKSGLASQGIDSRTSSTGEAALESPTPSTATPADTPVVGSQAASEPAADGVANGVQVQSSAATTTPVGDLAKADGPQEWNARALKHIASQIPSCLAPFFQAVVRLFQTRRSNDLSQKQKIRDTASVLADVLVKHLEQKTFDDKLSLFAYYTVMLGLATMLLVDERTSQKTLHTVLLVAFHRIGGLDAIFGLCRKFINTIDMVSQVPADERSDIAKQELVHAYGGLKVALHLLHPIVSAKALFDSSQTVLAITSDKAETDPAYFEPHNFFVNMRLATLPLLRDLWEAPWLVSAPLSLTKSVVQIIMELLITDGEEGKEVSHGPAPTVITSAIGVARTPAPPDEARIQQLTDMGFPRYAAERALVRARNNVNAATELLLSHPFPLPPDPEPAPATAEAQVPALPAPAAPELAQGEAAPPQGEAAPSQDEVAEASTESVDEPPQSSEGTGPSPLANAEPVSVKTSEELLKELHAAREPLKDGIGSRALKLVDEHPSLVFDVQRVFVGPPNNYREQSVRRLIDDIKAFSPGAYDVQEQPMAVRCRLLALVLSDPSSHLAQMSETDAKDLLDVLLALLLSNPSSKEGTHPTIPKWLAAHLLVVEALLTMGEEPRSVSLPKEGEPIEIGPVTVGWRFPEARTIMFDFCLRLLAIPGLPKDELLSALRIFVLLTRDHNVAQEFLRREGISLLFQYLRISLGTPSASGTQSYVAIILRHIAEDPSTLQRVMRQEIKRFFSHPRNRVVDVGSYVSSCGALALRDPTAFTQATAELCQLSQPFSSSRTISLKESSLSEQDASNGSGGETKDVDMQVEGPFPNMNTAPSEALESLTHFLISELMKAVRSVHNGEHSGTELVKPRDGENSGEAGGESSLPLPSTSSAPAQTRDEHGTQADDTYACFLMQCLTELLFSYEASKVAFLSFSPRKRAQTPAKEGPTKYRTAAIQFILSELIFFDTINPQPSAEAKKQIMLCNWAMSVIVALCVDTSFSHDIKDVSSDLVSVRKFVLEAISRAIRDLPISEPAERRYSRLLALADLSYRLLTVRFNATTRKANDESPTHIAKVMLEKNFVQTLTNALAEADLNYPHIRTVVTGILKPLEYLSKIAIKMSRVSDKNREIQEERAESVSSFMSDEEEETADHQGDETPDLYRNSSLGLFGGEMEDMQYGAEDDMDENGDEEEDDVEMDFGDETGSEDTTDTEDNEEDDLEDQFEHESGESEEGWQDEDEEDEEDLVENEDENDDDDDDGADEDEDEGEEVMWQDIAVGDEVLDHAPDEGDEEDEAGVPIMQMNLGEEGDAASEEDYGDDVGPADGAPVPNVLEIATGFANAFTDGGVFANDREGRQLFWTGPARTARRRGVLDDDLEIFGRSRNPPPTAPEAVTHPLLLNPGLTPSRGSISQSRRRVQRNVLVPGNPQDLLQTIEEAIGEGAAQFFHHIISHGQIGGEAIRIDLPPTALVPLRNHGRGGISAHIRLERAPRGDPRSGNRSTFDPLLTVQRWAEEVKIIHGRFEQTRLNKLVNHVILALLPAAIEAIERAKAAEAEAAAKLLEIEKTADQAAIIEEAPSASADQSEHQANPDVGELVHSPGPQPSATSEDTEMLDVATSGVSDATTAEPLDTAVIEVTTDATTAVEASTTEPTPDDESAEAGPSEVGERVTVMIHGSPVDITDTGIDPTFLEALPDDMREEVLNQHVREQRAARVERPADSQISSEFLDALPPEIRAEILQQESAERARQRAEETAAQQGNAGGPVDIDPASFLASLDPQLRQVVLMDSDDGLIQSLPSHMLAEAGINRDHARQARTHVPTRAAPTTPQTPQKAPVTRDAIQLLERPALATLIRLLFFPTVLRKNLLYRVLVNLCENAKTRTDLFNLLLNILQDGTGDLSAIDKSFAQMSFRSTKQASQQTPKSAAKQRMPSDYLGTLSLPQQQNEIVPELIVQRCLEALVYIVSSNELSSLFFLTEHELPPGMRRGKKGKGKEKQASQTHYPVVLLLSLLDRPSILKTPSIVESVVALLATITRPLATLKDTDKGGTESSELPPIPAPGSSSEQLTTPAVEPSQAAEASAPVQEAPAPEAPPVPTKQEEKVILAKPPAIPHPVLRSIVNVLTAGECSGRTFSQILALIQHLSYIPDARDVIANELRSRAQEFGQSLYTALDELANALQESKEDVLSSLIASKFSTASSDQAKLLRVLKTIDYMYSPKLTGTSSTTPSDTDVEKVQSIYESFRFTPLWKRLGDCLAIIEEKPEMEHIVTVLLPLIESLMVVCKYVGSKPANIAARVLRASASPRSAPTTRESMEDLFVSFTDAHRKILNLMVRNNPSLMSGSFSLLVNNPRVLDFDNKRNYFNQQLHRRPHAREHHGTLQLNVRRQRVFEDSFQHLQRKTGDQIKYGKLSVRFYEEEGVDAGGVTREWFQILARQMFDPNYALFQPCAADRLTYQPNKASWVNPEHLSFFKFVGRIIGKAIYDGRLLDAYFARSLYRQLLAKPVDYRDVEWVDPEYYNSLCWILENDPTPLELSFSVEADEFGVMKIVELKPDGASIPVTQENKKEFVQLSAQYRLYSSIKDQIESLLTGFYEIIPKDLISIFNEQELELLISGTPDIDVDEWRSATEYNGYTSSDPVIVWWWRALKSFNREERAKVLSFATGTSRVPLGGFVELQGVQGVQRFSIHKAYGDTDRLPQAHTCFNQIDLPQYSSYEMLRQQLLMAINEGGEGFGFA